MKKIHLYVLLLIISSWTLAFPQVKSHFDLFKNYNSDSCKADIAVLKSILLNVHPGINLHTSNQEITEYCDSVAKGWSGTISGITFHNTVALILAQLHDAHTFIDWSEAYNSISRKNIQVFPLQVSYLNDHYYVSGTAVPKYEKYVGMELLTISGKKIDDIANSIIAHSSIEGSNRSCYNYKLRGISIGYFMQYPKDDNFKIVVCNQDGRKKKIKLNGVSVGIMDSLNYPMYTHQIPPVEFKIKESIAILKINTFIAAMYADADIDYKNVF